MATRLIGSRRNWNTNPKVFKELADNVDIYMTVALRQIANEIVKTAQEILVDAGKFYTGKLVESFNVKDGRRRQEPTVIITNNAKHALIVEFGRRPGAGMPPQRMIRDWLGSRGLPVDDVTVYLVSLKISRDGIPGIRFMSRSIAQHAPTFNKVIKDTMDRFVSYTVRSTKKENVPGGINA